MFASVSLTLLHHKTHSGLGSLLSLDLCIYRGAMRTWGFGFFCHPGVGGGCPPKGWKGHTKFEGAAEKWCLDAPAPLAAHQDPTIDSSPSQHTPTLTKLAYPLPMIICTSAFFKVVVWGREMPSNRAPHSPAQQGGCPTLSPASPAKAISPEAQPQCWHCRAVWHDKIPKQSPCYAPVSRCCSAV